MLYWTCPTKASSIIMHGLIVCCFVAVLAAFSTYGYDFQDSDFNNFLSSDLEQLYSGEAAFLNPRNRRDEEAVNMDKCRRRRHKACCGEDLMEDLHSNDTIRRECFRESFEKDKGSRGPPPDPFKCDSNMIGRHRMKMMCVAKCMAEKRNLVDKDGNLKEADVRKLIEQLSAKKPWLAQKQEQMTTKCLEEAKNAQSSLSSDTDAEVCTPEPMTFMHCIYREIQLSCPDEEIKDQKFCARMRERMKKDGGDFMMPPPPPPEND